MEKNKSQESDISSLDLQKRNKINRWRQEWPDIIQNFKKELTSFEKQLHNFKTFPNEKMENALKEEKLYFSVKEIALDIARKKEQIRRMRKNIEKEGVEEILPNIFSELQILEEAAQAPVSRVQQIYTQKKVNHSVHKTHKGLSVVERTNHSRHRKASPCVRGHIKSGWN